MVLVLVLYTYRSTGHRLIDGIGYPARVDSECL